MKTTNQNIYGKYTELVRDGLIEMEEAARLARKEYREQSLITAIKSMQSAGQRIEMERIITDLTGMKPTISAGKVSNPFPEILQSFGMK